MRELTVTSWCDGGHEEKVPATMVRTPSFALDGSDRKVLDLCEACDRRYILPVVSLMESGADPEPPPKKRMGRPKGPALPTVCPDCGHRSPNRSALGQHVQIRHGKRLRDYAWDT